MTDSRMLRNIASLSPGRQAGRGRRSVGGGIARGARLAVGVRGPVDFRAFRRLAARLARETDDDAADSDN
jgi:hypothetical protein